MRKKVTEYRLSPATWSSYRQQFTQRPQAAFSRKQDET